MVNVDRSRVLGKEREPDVVCTGNRAPQRVLVDITDLEIFEEAPRRPSFTAINILP
jgi:hypothetical protein